MQPSARRSARSGKRSQPSPAATFQRPDSSPSASRKPTGVRSNSASPSAPWCRRSTLMPSPRRQVKPMPMWAALSVATPRPIDRMGTPASFSARPRPSSSGSARTTSSPCRRIQPGMSAASRGGSSRVGIGQVQVRGQSNARAGPCRCERATRPVITTHGEAMTDRLNYENGWSHGTHAIEAKLGRKPQDARPPAWLDIRYGRTRMPPTGRPVTLGRPTPVSARWHRQA